MKRDRLLEFIAAIMKDYEVYGPKADRDIVAFRLVGTPDELVLDYRNSTVSPKELFIPRAEVVYELDGHEFVDSVQSEKKRIIVGIRPCDCLALTLLDRVFDSATGQEPFYIKRRQNTTVISLACRRPLSTCFCTSVGGDPFGEEGADILLDREGDMLIAKGVTSRGDELMTEYGELLSRNHSGHWKEQAAAARKRLKQMPKLDNAESRLRELFEDDIWEAVSRKCQGCGICSYLCPTCYCFDLADERTANGARKVRSWDCCMFPSFTLHASGHNPRPVNAARMRQKIMHKFSYYPEVHDVNSCVGCGRCVRSCPVNLDIRQLLGEIMGTATKAAVT